jgi:hypothetical protein
MAKVKLRETLLTTLVNRPDYKLDVVMVGKFKNENTPVIPNVVRLREWILVNTEVRGYRTPTMTEVEIGVGRLGNLIQALQSARHRAEQAVEEKRRRDELTAPIHTQQAA